MENNEFKTPEKFAIWEEFHFNYLFIITLVLGIVCGMTITFLLIKIFGG